MLIHDSATFKRHYLRRGHAYDVSLIWVVALMCTFSLIMVYSSSVAFAANDNGTPFYFLTRQSVFLFLGSMVALGAAKTPLSVWKKMTPPILVFSLLLLVVVLGVGRVVNGAQRWIHLGGISIQPSEIFKLAVVLYLSSFFTRRAEVLKDFRKVWYVGLPVVIGLFLVMRQPDFGSFVVTLMVAVGLLFLAGLPLKWFMGVLAICIASMVALIMAAPYRIARVTGFLDPWKDPFGDGYQLTHSLMAFGRGGWFGEGLGASMEKRFFLTESHTDFILAVIGEEFGFVGLVLLIVCYVWLVWRAFAIGRQARDLELPFAAFVAKGIGIWIGIQSFFNIGVNVGMLPTKGLTLPLISYGGSALMVMLLCIGLLLRVDYENRRVMRGFKV